jgi:Rrf2 family iron-sulfur cluster assembly transcriptional regulator
LSYYLIYVIFRIKLSFINLGAVSLIEFMVSKACEYGIRSVIFIANNSVNNKRVSLGEIAESIASPAAFTAKILQKLVKNNVVQSLKGPNGGFYISIEALATLSLIDIVRSIDGEALYTSCALGLPECHEKRPCPLHNDIKKVRAGLKTLLEETSIKMLAHQVQNGSGFLKINYS